MKYFHDLFYIGPIYHRKFLALDRFHTNIIQTFLPKNFQLI